MDQMAMISLGLSVQMEHWRDESNMETRNERTSRKIPGQVMDESDLLHDYYIIILLRTVLLLLLLLLLHD